MRSHSLAPISSKKVGLTKRWEKTFFFMPLARSEGPDHLERLERVVVLAEMIALEAPERLRLWATRLCRAEQNQATGAVEI